MKDQLFVEGRIKDGKLHFPIKAFQIKYDNFFKQHEDGARVEVFIGVQDGKGSNPQLARVHAMIREIANDIGYTFMEVKLIVKRNTGLCFMKDKTEYCKSFADCDRDDLNLCIQECIRIGDEQGIQLR